MDISPIKSAFLDCITGEDVKEKNRHFTITGTMLVLTRHLDLLDDQWINKKLRWHFDFSKARGGELETFIKKDPSLLISDDVRKEFIKCLK